MNTSRKTTIQQIGDAFMQFKRAMHMYGTGSHSATDLSPAQLVLLRFIHTSEPISHKALASIMQMTPGAISQLLDGLAESGYVTRTPSEADRRVMYLSITRHGKLRLDQYCKYRDKLLTNAFSDVSDDDLATFLKVQQSATAWIDSQIKATKK